MTTEPFVWGEMLSRPEPRTREYVAGLMRDLGDALLRAADDVESIVSRGSDLPGEMLAIRARHIESLYRELVEMGEAR